MSDTEATPVSPKPKRYAVKGQEHKVIGYLLQCLESLAARTRAPYPTDAQDWAEFHLKSLDELGWTEKR